METTTTGLPEPLLNCLKQNEAYLSGGKRTALHSNVSIEEAEALYEMVRQLQPERTVEIGFAQGVSAAAILKALEDNGKGEHAVVYPFQKQFEYAGIAMARQCGLEHRLRFFEKFAEEVIPNVGRPFGFAFIDASHLFDLSIVDFVLVDKVLSDGGVIGFHDLWMPALQKLVRYILSNRQYEVFPKPPPVPKTLKTRISRLLQLIPKSDRFFTPEILQPWSSLGLDNLVFLRKTSADKRPWEFHRTF